MRLALKLVLAAATIALAFVSLRGMNFTLVASHLRALPHGTIAVALALSLAQAVFLATRLWAVFPSHARPEWMRVARAFGFGQLVNTYTPGRAGDVVKVLALARREEAAALPEVPPAPTSAAADATGVLLADKGLDVFSLLVLVAVFGHHMVSGMLAGAGHSAGPAAAIACGAAVAWLALRRFAPGLLAKVRAGVTATLRATRSLLTPTRLGIGLGLALAGWAAEAALMMILAAPLGVHLTAAQAVVGLLVLNLGIAVPVSVANLGAYEAATVVGLAPFGASTTQALAIGTLHHAIQIATVLLFALVFWVRDRVARAR